MKKAKVIIDRDFTISEIDEKVFSSFVEPLGRCVYGGLYEPGHPTADEDGFRQDVLEYTKPLNLTLNRFPGGNFTSTYRWEDGIGPKEKRPRRPEVAWQCIETNEFGLDEFDKWSKKNGSDVMMTVNLATRGVLEAMDCVEYCNFEGGTYWSDKRREHGYEKPFNYKYWCLSNEIDGIWQVGQKPGREYGLLAKEASKGMKLIDTEIKTVLAGSSSPGMDTFPSFDEEALDVAWEQIDYLSVHHYIGNWDNDSENYMAKPLVTNKYFDDLAGLLAFMKRKKRSNHDVYISFDEFNTWHSIIHEERFEKKWRIAPPLLEDIYTAEDALALGGMLLAVLRHADVVKIACVSELVNCISHLRTSNGGGCWAMPAYYSFLHYSQYGRGTAMDTKVISDTYDCRDFREVPYLDAQAVMGEDGSIKIFAINRSLEDALDLSVILRGYEEYQVEKHIVLTADDPKATNTESEPFKVVPTEDGNARMEQGEVKAELAKMSWNVIVLKKI